MKRRRSFLDWLLHYFGHIINDPDISLINISLMKVRRVRTTQFFWCSSILGNTCLPLQRLFGTQWCSLSSSRSRLSSVIFYFVFLIWAWFSLFITITKIFFIVISRFNKIGLDGVALLALYFHQVFIEMTYCI